MGSELSSEDFAAFWQWVCTRRPHDNPRGDFIRDTRRIRSAHDPNEEWWEACSLRMAVACPEALAEYRRLVRQFNLLPRKPSFESNQVVPDWTPRLRRMLLPYCIWHHESGRTYLVNRYSEPIWCLDAGSSEVWRAIDTPLWVSGRFSKEYLYDDHDESECAADIARLVELAMNRLSASGLPILTRDCRTHPRSTEGPVSAGKFSLAIHQQLANSSGEAA